MSASLTKLDAHLWAASRDNALPGGIHLGVTMIVARLPSGTLWLCSPIPMDDALAAQLQELGPVSDIVAPNLFHNAWAAAAKERFPAATLHAPAGLRRKLAQLAIDAELRDGSGWQGAIETIALRGAPLVEEHVFLHRDSRTLIVTDMLFHISSPRNWQTRLLLWMVGCQNGLAMSRSWRLIFIRDRAAMAGSIRRVLSWDFDRLTVAHGEIIERGAHQRVAAATASLLAGAPLPPPGGDAQ